MPNTGDSGGESGREAERQQPQKRLKITASNGYLARNKFHAVKKLATGSIPPKTKAKLGLLPSLPLDVLFEIFGHLLPLDVLHLARTTKDFRRVLMHKSAISIWRSALANVPGLPECPPSMSQPALANLAFDPHCHNCLAPNIRNIDWKLRLRLCVRCTKTCLLSADKFNEDVKRDKIILRCVPFSNWSGRSIQYCTIKAKEDFMKQLGAFDGDRSVFVKKKKAERKAWSEYAAKCKSWSDSLIKTRTQELDNIREDRKDAIFEKLVALGYSEELDFLHKFNYPWQAPNVILFDDHPLVKAPKPLTDRIWNNIESDMVEYMETAKAERLKQERRECLQSRQVLVVKVWNEYRRLNPTNDLMPGTLDIWMWAEVERIINLPSEVTVDQAMFTKIIPKLPTFIENWQHNNISKLVHRNELDIPFPRQYSDQVRQLQLAACIFTCEDKDYLHMTEDDSDSQHYPCMWYPEFIHHACNSVGRITWRPDPDIAPLDKNPALKLKNEFPSCRRKEWSIDGLFFDSKASHTVRKILDACGLDYRTVTVEELDKLDPRVVCLKCSFGYKCDGERRFPVRTWRNAVQHCMKTHWGNRAVEWQKISDEDTAQARILEEKEETKRSTRPNINQNLRCAHCRDKPSDVGKMTNGKLNNHLRHYHNIWVDIQEGKDYYKALDCPPNQPLTIKMVPKKL